MEYRYFIIVNGQQAGPFPRYELKAYGLTPESFVWREGLANWERAANLPELSDLFAPQREYSQRAEHYPNPDEIHTPYDQPGSNPYGQPGPNPYGQPGYGPNAQGPGWGAPISHTNWLPWAIVGTVLGCCTSCLGMIFGIIGIVQANKANAFYARGEREMGDMTNANAKTMVIISLVIAGLGIVGSAWLLSTGYISQLSTALSSIR